MQKTYTHTRVQDADKKSPQSPCPPRRTSRPVQDESKELSTNQRKFSILTQPRPRPWLLGAAETRHPSLGLLPRHFSSASSNPNSYTRLIFSRWNPADCVGHLPQPCPCPRRAGERDAKPMAEASVRTRVDNIASASLGGRDPRRSRGAR